MLKIITILSCLFLMSCVNSHPKYKLLYEFENNAQISDAERSTTIEVLKNRLGKFSTDFDVKLTNDRKIEVVASTSFDKSRINSLMTNQGKLEFWELYKSEELIPFFVEADKIQKEEIQNDTLVLKSISDLISSGAYPNSPILFYVKQKDTALVNANLKKQTIRNLLPIDYKYTKFLWGIPNEMDELPLYAAKSNREDMAFVTGEQIINARQGYNAIGRPTVSIQMDANGAHRWERMTGNAYRGQTCIAITINNLVYSAPGVTSGPIEGGYSEISGSFTLEEALDMATILGSSKSIPKLKLLQSSIIEN